MKRLNLGPRQIQPPPHISQAQLHALNFRLRIEKPRRRQSFLIMIAQLFNLDPARQFRAGKFHHFGGHNLGLPPPFIAQQKRALRQVERGKLRIDRHRNNRVRQHHIAVFQTRPLRPKQNRDPSALPNQTPRHLHRPLRRHDRLRQFPPPRGGGENIFEVRNRGFHIRVQPRMIQQPPGTAGHRDRL